MSFNFINTYVSEGKDKMDELQTYSNLTPTD